jgi:hypothetical protein
MNLKAKTALLVIGGLILLSGLGIVIYPIYRFYQFVTYDDTTLNSNPVEVAATAQAIIHYELPAGYHENSSLDHYGLTTILIANEPEGAAFLLTFSPGTTIPTEAMSPSFLQPDLEMKIVSQRTITIRAETTTLTRSEGIGTDGQPFRQETAYFMSGGGLVKFTAMGSAEKWDQTVIDEFLESIR